ncbi:hypothetical protein HF086_001151 [Spodoptera exigua]|uniref:Uncharacterized protein n=1 Tax=Spodoptera exigua TaxID=7107 RepID=A0A922M1D0_SPOEX|nr:hypothetical protein HF086_001151 [Spodoptera exigua]
MCLPPLAPAPARAPAPAATRAPAPSRAPAPTRALAPAQRTSPTLVPTRAPAPHRTPSPVPLPTSSDRLLPAPISTPSPTSAQASPSPRPTTSPSWSAAHHTREPRELSTSIPLQWPGTGPCYWGAGGAALSPAECATYSQLARVNPEAAHWYLVGALGRALAAPSPAPCAPSLLGPPPGFGA